MADQPTNPRIEELKSRLQADPKSRLFFPYAEELRKLKRLDEAEKTLRDGLAVHTSYLSAWISLGRVLRALGINSEAIEVLEKALALDPGNVVAARLLAEAYEETGDVVSAVKKYKLVAALLPGDDEVNEKIENLEAAAQQAESEAATERYSLSKIPLTVPVEPVNFDQTAEMAAPQPVAPGTQPGFAKPLESEAAAPEEPHASLPPETVPVQALAPVSLHIDEYPAPEQGVAEHPAEPEPEPFASEPVPIEPEAPSGAEEVFDETAPIRLAPFEENAEISGGTSPVEGPAEAIEPAESVFESEGQFEEAAEIPTEMLPGEGFAEGSAESVFESEASYGERPEVAEPEWPAPFAEPAPTLESSTEPEVEAAPESAEERSDVVTGLGVGPSSRPSFRRRKIESLERWIAKVGVKGRAGDRI